MQNVLTLKEVMDKCGSLKIFEKRSATDDYIELVFHNEETGEWNKLLSDFFGPAAKPPKAKPSKNDISITKVYGGIRPDQTLFRKDFDDAMIIAMFWPWQDGAHTTLKIFLIRK